MNELHWHRHSGAISIVGILACNRAASPTGSTMGVFTNGAMMDQCP
jgi:hypothetical protein